MSITRPGGCASACGRPTEHGSDEPTWLLDARWDDVPRVALTQILRRHPRVLVVGPRADDATRALGATIADLETEGHPVTVVEAPARLPELVDAATLVIAPEDCDGVEEVVLERSAALLWHPVPNRWASPDDVDWSRLRTLTPTLRSLQAKRRALNDPRDAAGRVIETVLVPRSEPLFERVSDCVSDRARDEVAMPFDAMYADGVDDPWDFDESPYELRRFDLVIASLGRENYRRAIEIGCATGQLATRLRDTADEVVGLDASPEALRVARSRCDTVRWLQGVVPRDIPDESFDLIVVSEIGYFLDGVDLLATMRVLRRRLTANGELVVANWRGPTENIPLDGPTVQQQVRDMLDLPVRAHHHDDDLFIDVWGHR